uniref:HECT-type E3 ubiquitin transferase n=1 Tax=Chromera velia CCMP2878 TaxID=1169474 RepID=A0A0G4HEI3_9ALVE|eukprot:Cvel_26624.t1-p1 / transcript=Cvel_26624.t1 / gene=Cvel_26624 / organism=Chromera_velia_CCMP2878 / gene_product=E3 ubiquitin-protein ligase UPL6, putative / transcript_product=E3 ubiquitin-protein ligase UPL6, putative / location=Cvel_scaffold3197:4376-16803(+) / protein_length=1207 / sequence_SO=supercontig / SO=protein_coding / is_pseudo=false
MFSFDGKSKSRNVSLGGQSKGKTATKQGFLDKQRKERQERERQRNREKASLSIQRVWRSHKALTEEAVRVRGDFDSLTAELKQSQGESPSGSLEVDRKICDALPVLMRYVAFSFVGGSFSHSSPSSGEMNVEGESDRDRLSSSCGFFLHSAQSRTETNVLSDLLSEGDGERERRRVLRVVQVRGFCRTLLRTPDIPTHIIAELLGVLVTFGGDTGVTHQQMEKSLEQIFSFLAARARLFPWLGKALREAAGKGRGEKDEGQAAQLLKTAGLAARHSHPLGSSNFHSIISGVFGVPLLFERVPTAAREGLGRNRDLLSVVSSVRTDKGRRGSKRDSKDHALDATGDVVMMSGLGGLSAGGGEGLMMGMGLGTLSAEGAGQISSSSSSSSASPTGGGGQKGDIMSIQELHLSGEEEGLHTAVWVLANLIEIVKVHMGDGAPLPSGFLGLLQSVHAQVPSRTLRNLLNRASSSSGRNIVGLVAGGGGKGEGSSAAPPFLERQIGTMVDRDFITFLLSGSGADGASGLEDWAPLLELYFPVPPAMSVPERGGDDEDSDFEFEASGGHSSSSSSSSSVAAAAGGKEGTSWAAPVEAVLSALAFHTDLSLRLFQAFRKKVAEECGGRAEEVVNQMGKAPDFRSPLGSVLSAFCCLYAHQLRIVYDVEFFKQEDHEGDREDAEMENAEDGTKARPASARRKVGRNPLRLSDVSWLAPLLNQILFKVIKAQCGVADSFKRRPAAHTLRARVGDLVRSLYDRGGRRPFVLPNAWLIAETQTLIKNRMAALEEVRGTSLRGVGSIANSGVRGAEATLTAVLAEMPHSVPFDDRVLVFYNGVMQDKEQVAMARQRAQYGHGSVHTIRRDYIVEDGLASLGSLSGENLRDVFRVQFVDEHGQVESGIDGGGLFKEFLISLSRTAFDVNYGLFAATEDQSLVPSPSAFMIHPNAQELYVLLGKVVGKALYEQTLIEPTFNRVFLTLLLGRQNQVDDVPFLDKELHKNLMFVKDYPGDVADLALHFSVTDNTFGAAKEVPLMPGGEQRVVTNNTKFQYLRLMGHFKTNRQLKEQTNAFLSGFEEIIPLEWLRMFNQEELQSLISGTRRGFDVRDLREHTQYTGGFNGHSPTVQLFWETLESMPDSDRGAFLMFVTSCPRAPLLGFKNLYPSFTIHRVPDRDRLPTASTCVNLLKLPDYEDAQVLRQKLRQAIGQGGGFGLS